jgi:hypothetical protein
MIWDRSETLALAELTCARCKGLGLTYPRGKQTPCNCVFRSIFRSCFKQFRHIVKSGVSISTVRLEYVGKGSGRRIMYGNRRAEFMADFHLIAKRTLTAFEWRIFSYHFLLGADWNLCCTRLNMERGKFFHAVYRVEQKLGRVFRELEPYPLFPVDEYFSGGSDLRETKATPVEAPSYRPLRPPVSVAL